MHSDYDVRNLEYDGLDRLLSASSPAFGTLRYDYDKRGNITRLTHAGQTQSYHYNSNDLLSSVTGAVSRTFSYDSAGRVTDNGHLSFAYNAADQMIAAGTEQYQYDAHGHRLTKPSGNTNRLTIYNRDGQLLMTRQHGQNTYKVLLDQDTVAQTGAGGTRYFHHDALGSVVAESSAGGQLKRQHYRPFGLPVDAYSSPNEQGYTGHVHDDTGLVYMQARYYDPVIGRFYSNDPIGALDHLSTPNGIHGFNRYAYANNNPYKYVDPNGETTAVAAGIGGTFVCGPICGGIAFVGTAILTGYALSEIADSGDGSTSSEQGSGDETGPNVEGDNTAPEGGTIFVDSAGNALVGPEGSSIAGSPDGTYTQVKDKDGNPTGTRKDGGHSPAGHPDSRAQQPHGHVNGVSNSDGTPWLPLKEKKEQ